MDDSYTVLIHQRFQKNHYLLIHSSGFRIFLSCHTSKWTIETLFILIRKCFSKDLLCQYFITGFYPYIHQVLVYRQELSVPDQYGIVCSQNSKNFSYFSFKYCPYLGPWSTVNINSVIL